jgi:hypothetical protein
MEPNVELLARTLVREPNIRQNCVVWPKPESATAGWLRTLQMRHIGGERFDDSFESWLVERGSRGGHRPARGRDEVIE